MRRHRTLHDAWGRPGELAYDMREAISTTVYEHGWHKSLSRGVHITVYQNQIYSGIKFKCRSRYSGEEQKSDLYRVDCR